VLVENRVAGRLVRALTGPLGGRSLQQKQSFLEGKLGSQIASKLLTMTDDPHVVRGFGSRLYDGDGIATKKRAIIEKGILKSYYIDDYYGRKLKMDPTTGGSTNLIFGLGTKSFDELVRDMRDGVVVTGFLGGNSNATTGDFSLGVQGFVVEKGKMTKPIAEVNMSGNQSGFWKKLAAVGADPYSYSSMRTPSLLFDAAEIAGA
jgi:PmbA protein